MRTLVFLCTFAIASQCAATERNVSVFIAPRSSLVPASGKVIIDVYWFNSSKRPRAVPNLESYSVMQSINSRSGRGLGEPREVLTL